VSTGEPDTNWKTESEAFGVLTASSRVPSGVSASGWICGASKFFGSLKISGQLIFPEMRMRSAVFVAAVVLSAVAARAQVHGKDRITLPNPPVVKTEPVVDEYKSAASCVSTKITDPYRWLEDAHSSETRAYITA